MTRAEPSMPGHQAGASVADEAYDSDAVAVAAKRQWAEAVIPPKEDREGPRDHDGHLCAEREPVEWSIDPIERYRRVAARCEETARNFLGWVHGASILVLSR